MSAPSSPAADRDTALRETIEHRLWTVIQETAWARGVTMLDSDRAAFIDALLPVVLADRDAHAREVAAAEFNAGTTILADLLRLTYDVQQDSKLGSAEGREAERVADAFRERIGRHCDERNGRRRLDRAAALDGEGGK